MASSGLPFTPEFGWHLECVRRPEAICYISNIAAQVRAGDSWARGAWMPFSAGLVAGIRLAREPPGDED